MLKNRCSAKELSNYLFKKNRQSDVLDVQFVDSHSRRLGSQSDFGQTVLHIVEGTSDSVVAAKLGRISYSKAQEYK